MKVLLPTIIASSIALMAGWSFKTGIENEEARLRYEQRRKNEECSESFGIDFNNEEARLEDLIAERADVNNDGFTSHEEWYEIYKKVRSNIIYDAKNPPSDLTKKEMEDYLSLNK